MKHLLNKTVMFNKLIADFDGYPEPGMRAKIINIYREVDGCYRITFDFSEYEIINAFFETADFFGDDGSANKTAREVGAYTPQENLWFSAEDVNTLSDYFTVIGDRQNRIYDMFNKSGEKDYVKWLEDQVVTD